MKNLFPPKSAVAVLPILLILSSLAHAEPAAHWEPCGWGGGGFYFGAAFHPGLDGVMYLGGNVAGFYKSEDHGRTWKFSNQGLHDYIIHALAVDPASPGNVYASTVGGLHKSTDAGTTWKFIPDTGKDKLRLTGERDLSIQPVAVDPSDSRIVYAGSPGGTICKSEDGAQTWQVVSQPEVPEDATDAARVQFGKNGGAPFAGVWQGFSRPETLAPEDCQGLAFRMKAQTAAPERFFVTITTAAGHRYQSKDLSRYFTPGEWQDVVLGPADFTPSETARHDNPELAKTAPAVPDWAKVTRMDFGASGALPKEAHVMYLKSISYVTRQGESQALVPAVEFAPESKIQAYGNARVGSPVPGAVYSVDVARKIPGRVAAATADRGVLLSEDAGRTWRSLETPRHATSVVFDPADPAILYGSFATDGVWKSADAGKTWQNVSGEFGDNFAVRQVVVNPSDSRLVYAIGSAGWQGAFFRSEDAGKTWVRRDTLKVEPSNPTIVAAHGWAETVPMSRLTNIGINPLNPRQIFLSSNWRPILSEDGGDTWTECDRDADISVITDIRFSGPRTYATAMDEGGFVSADNGKTWKQLWPRTFSESHSGHAWRVAATEIDGVDRVIGTQAPWAERQGYKMFVGGSEGGDFVTEGLPAYVPKRNTMWGRGYPRALAVDPNNPDIVWLGIDGDAEPGRSGGGIFRSADGGRTWKQLPNQPGSRRMFYGLAVDPTDSRRIFWGSCGSNGGLWRSEDSGETWENVFSRDRWIFNVHVTKTGEIYVGGRNLWHSADHGKTWTQLTQFPSDRSVCGIETHPDNPEVIWCSAVTWNSKVEGGVFKSVDHGKTWTEITGDLPYVKPLVLRFNPRTKELWCGSVGLFRTPQ